MLLFVRNLPLIIKPLCCMCHFYQLILVLHHHIKCAGASIHICQFICIISVSRYEQSRFSLSVWKMQVLVTIFASALHASPITPNEVALRKIAVSEVWTKSSCSQNVPVLKFNFVVQAKPELLSTAVKYADPRLLRVIFLLTLIFLFPNFPKIMNL